MIRRKNSERRVSQRGTVLQAGVMIALIVLYLAALAIINREDVRPRPAQADDASTSDDLSVELRRCNALAPHAPDEAHCRTTWAENGRRFFDLPPKFSARLPASQSTPLSTAAQPSSTSFGDRAR